MSMEAMEAVLANSKGSVALRGILLALAWKTYDRAPPFTGPFTVAYIATLANVKHRQAQTHIAALKKLGELVVTGKEGRAHVYGVNVPLANYAVSDVDNYAVSDVDNYAVSDVDSARPDANYAVSDVDNYAVSDVDNYAVSDVVTTQYPAFGSYKETRNKREQRVTSPPHIIESLRTQIAEAEQRQTPPPSPPPQKAEFIWRSVRDYLAGEVSDHELRSWAQRVVADWAAPDTLRLRGPATLLGVTRFTNSVRYALAKLSDERYEVEFKAI